MKKLLSIVTCVTLLASCTKENQPTSLIPLTLQQKLSGKWQLVNSSYKRYIPSTNTVPIFADSTFGLSGDSIIFKGNKAYTYKNGSNNIDTFLITYINSNTLVFEDDLKSIVTFTLNQTSVNFYADITDSLGRTKAISNLKR